MPSWTIQRVENIQYLLTKCKGAPADEPVITACYINPFVAKITAIAAVAMWLIISVVTVLTI